MTAITAMGTHDGYRRLVTRGVRAIARGPLLEGTYETPQRTINAIRRWAAATTPTGHVLTWVPGHDGTGGPGRVLAEILADVWQLPVADLVTRTRPLVSAHASGLKRPSLEQQHATMTAHHRPPAADVVIVDNTIASGASITAAVDALTCTGINVTSLVAITSALIDIPR